MHVFPHTDDLVREVRDAGLVCEHVYRDQRAYHRTEGQVRGYAVLRARA